MNVGTCNVVEPSNAGRAAQTRSTVHGSYRIVTPTHASDRFYLYLTQPLIIYLIPYIMRLL